MNVKGLVDLGELAEKIRAIETRHSSQHRHRFIDEPAENPIPTGWPDIDAISGGGLPAGGLHEWFGVNEGSRSMKTDRRPTHRSWTPPLCILSHLGWQVLEHGPRLSWTLWVGKACHPYPRVLIRADDSRLLTHSLFVDPPDRNSRVWAIDLALRSPAVGCVIADGRDFDRADTQRLQYLSRSQGKTVLTARPPGQQDRLSAAQTRWDVNRVIPGDAGAGGAIDLAWSVELLRCKGMQPIGDHPAWVLEWNGDQGTVHLSTRLADLAGPEKVGGSRPSAIRQQTA